MARMRQLCRLVILFHSLRGFRDTGQKKALRGLISDGLIEYKSQGRPAVVSNGEYQELVYDAMPPINGYALTKKAFQTEEWLKAKTEWNASMEEWANG